MCYIISLLHVILYLFLFPELGIGMNTEFIEKGRSQQAHSFLYEILFLRLAKLIAHVILFLRLVMKSYLRMFCIYLLLVLVEIFLCSFHLISAQPTFVHAY